jgi:hypothetical protein
VGQTSQGLPLAFTIRGGFVEQVSMSIDCETLVLSTDVELAQNLYTSQLAGSSLTINMVLGTFTGSFSGSTFISGTLLIPGEMSGAGCPTQPLNWSAQRL